MPSRGRRKNKSKSGQKKGAPLRSRPLHALSCHLEQARIVEHLHAPLVHAVARFTKRSIAASSSTMECIGSCFHLHTSRVVLMNLAGSAKAFCLPERMRLTCADVQVLILKKHRGRTSQATQHNPMSSAWSWSARLVQASPAWQICWRDRCTGMKVLLQ